MIERRAWTENKSLIYGEEDPAKHISMQATIWSPSSIYNAPQQNAIAGT